MNLNLQGSDRISWPDNTTATAFEIQIASDPDFNDVVFHRPHYTGLSVLPDSLQPDMTYHWRIRGLNTQGWGPWSAVSTLTTTQSIWSDLDNFSGWLFGWLGWIQEVSPDHIFHLNLGSIYYTGASQDSLWLYVYAQNLSWVWAGKGLYPFMYSPGRGYIMHLEGTGWFLDWDTEEWFLVTP
jgi:hypothetical protein